MPCLFGVAGQVTSWTFLRRFGNRIRQHRQGLLKERRNMEQQSKIRPLALVMTILSGLARLLPHPPNFTPVGSMSLFAGARLNGWMAYLVPLAIMIVTDPLVGIVFGTKGYTRSSVFVYASFLISVWIGRQL